MKDKQEPTGASIVSLADARKRRDEEQADVAPFEAFEPQATLLQGEDWLVTACDGEQHYVFTITKHPRAKVFKITEVYPGLAKRSTAVRDAKEPRDLVFTGKHTDVQEALEDIAEALLGDLVPEDAEGGGAPN